MWWQHPRNVYAEAIQEKAWHEAAITSSSNWFSGDSTKNYKRMGRSRKKIISYTMREQTPEIRQQYAVVQKVSDQLKENGIDFEVTASCKLERLNWAMGFSLVAPIEVRNEMDLKLLADLARKLILGATTLQAEFPGYCYHRADWLK